MVASKQDKKIEVKTFTSYVKKVGEAYRTLEWDEERINKFLRFLERWLDRKQYRILELGCGTGTFTRPVTRIYRDLITVDLVLPLLKIARNLNASKDVGSSFVACDAERLPFQDSIFDVIFCTFLLHHFPIFDNVLLEARRVLLPGGLFFALEPNKWNLVSVYKHAFALDDTANEVIFGPRYLVQTLKKCGFAVVDLKSINFDFHKSLRTLEKFIERLPLINLLGGCLTVCAKKT